jgi:hypothetical protein
LLQLCGRYGYVSFIRSDRGGQFISDVFSKLVQLMGSKQILTIGYRPQSNGIVERANSEMKRHLIAIVQHRRIAELWSMGLPLVQRILNATVHSVTGFAPAMLLFGNAINLNRSIFAPPQESVLVDYPSYVQKLCRVQAHAIAASQEHLAADIDRRIINAHADNSTIKKFDNGDLLCYRSI